MSDVKLSNPKDAIGSGKVHLELWPDTATVAGAMAFFEGAQKYGRYNWRAVGVRASIYVSAARRHIMKWWNGEECSEDNGLPHLWNALACIAILIDAAECAKLEDDRPPSAPVSKMLDHMPPLMEALTEMHKERHPHQYTIADEV